MKRPIDQTSMEKTEKKTLPDSLPVMQNENTPVEEAAFTPSMASEIKRTIEGLLFAAHEPLTIGVMTKILQHTFQKHLASILSPKVTEILLCELQQEYRQQHRAFQIEPIAKGWVLKTCPSLADSIYMLHHNKFTEKLSKPTMEVLSIVAFKQPITRAEIEAIRGVDSSSLITTLMEKELVEVVGKKESPGKPALLGTTNKFLEHFGLQNLEQIKNYFDEACPIHPPSEVHSSTKVKDSEENATELSP